MIERAFVTGAHGAIGRKLVETLHDAGVKVAGIGNGPHEWQHGTPIDAWFSAPINAVSLDRAVDQIGPPDAVFHLAGGSSVHASLSNPSMDFERTVGSTVEIMQWPGLRLHRPALVYASSAAVYGDQASRPITETATMNPKSPYGLHKMIAEKTISFWSMQYGFPSTVVRLFSVYGEGLQKQLVYDVGIKLLSGTDRIDMFGTGRELRDWLWIGDAARLLTRAAKVAKPGTFTVNGCSGIGTSVATIATLLKSAANSNCALHFRQKERQGDPDNLVGSTERLASIGFEASMPLEEGLSRTIKSLIGRD